MQRACFPNGTQSWLVLYGGTNQVEKRGSHKCTQIRLPDRDFLEGRRTNRAHVFVAPVYGREKTDTGLCDCVILNDVVEVLEENVCAGVGCRFRANGRRRYVCAVYI